MLKDFIYFNEDLINKYGCQVSDDFMYEFDKIKVGNTKGGGFSGGFKGLVSLDANTGGSKELEGNIIKNVSTIYSKFEGALNERRGEVYFDFLDMKETDFYDDLTLVGRNLVTVEGKFMIPNDFDIMDITQQYKHMILEESLMDTSEEDEFIKKVFIDQEHIIVPIKLKLGDHEVNAFSKIRTDFLLTEYDDIDEYENEDLVFTFKSNGFKKVIKPKIVYDVNKDFIKYPRAIRREFIKEKKSSIDGFNNIYMEEDYLDIEIITIYK